MCADLVSLRLKFSIFLLFSLTAGCTDAPTSPSFRYAGTWNGIWKDYYSASPGGVPNGSSLTLNVAKNGSASATGLMEEHYSNGTLTDRIDMTLTVFPDGLVSGHGEWRFSFPGMFGLSGEGEVIGQLDAQSGTGSGDLLIELDDILFHFPWRVEKQ